MIQTIIFDMDDTLLQCARYYNDRKQLFGELASERLKIPKSLCIEILTNIDLSCTTLDHGFSKHRFPRSFAAASAALDLISGGSIDEVAVEESYLLGQSVFTADYEPIQGAIDVLEQYKQSGVRLLLWSKGDYTIQKQKVIKNNLDRFFDSSGIYIVPKKQPEDIVRILSDHNLKADHVVVVGDSLRDDIRCGNAAGVMTVWVRGSFNTAWAYENQQHQPTYTIDSVAQLPSVISIDKVSLTALAH